jgi:hypothetical protein
MEHKIVTICNLIESQEGIKKGPDWIAEECLSNGRGRRYDKNLLNVYDERLRGAWQDETG